MTVGSDADRGPRHIALIGLSGTGKSTLAPVLAARTGMSAVDIDQLIEQRFGRSVHEVFETLGEPEFRHAEAELLGGALDGPPAVVATGGGIVVDPANRSRLAAASFVVWLRSDIDVLVERLSRSDESRPLLAADPESALRRLAAEREPLYLEVADLEIDVSGLHPQQIADIVQADHRSPGGGSSAPNVQAPT